MMGQLKRSKMYAKKRGEQHKAKPALSDARTHNPGAVYRPSKRSVRKAIFDSIMREVVGGSVPLVLDEQHAERAE
jgi:hypothetical protein